MKLIMKEIIMLLLLGLIVSENIQAQVIFEYDYDSASTFSSGNPAAADQLLLVQFEVSGERYVKINRHGRKILIYDLNHSLLKTIDVSGFPLASAPNYNYFLYFSELLFDTDPGIEFMFIANYNTSYTGIYNDDGSLIFADTGAALIFASFPSQQYPIYNTLQGTKMILSYSNGHAKVFSLPGTLSSSIEETNNRLLSAGHHVSNPYPNPSSSATRVDYTLPDGATEGEMLFYDLQGREVKRFRVDRSFDHLLISTADLPAGTYYYRLQAAGEASGGRKMMVVR